MLDVLAIAVAATPAAAHVPGDVDVVEARAPVDDADEDAEAEEVNDESLSDAEMESMEQSSESGKFVLFFLR